MRTIPGMVVMCPSDDVEARACVRAALEYVGPVYIRFGRAAVPVINDRPDYKFEIGKGTVVKNSVIMQNTSIGSKCSLNCVITDKDVEIVDDRVLTGSQSYPLYISKGAKI